MKLDKKNEILEFEWERGCMVGLVHGILRGSFYFILIVLDFNYFKMFVIILCVIIKNRFNYLE